MGTSVTYKYGTEEDILALGTWVERAFYYPNDKSYFYQCLNGELKKYGSGEESSVGVKLNGNVIGGIKSIIESHEILEIPEQYEYNAFQLNVSGTINNEGIINTM